MQVTWQPTLFGRGPARPCLAHARRMDLGGGAWVEQVPGCIGGQDEVFETLVMETDWTRQRRRMYDRVVDVPRLTASLPDDGPGHPVLDQVGSAFSERYGWILNRVSLAFYRDGRDSVAWHGDRMGAMTGDCVIAILSLGSPRRLLMRPTGGGRSRVFALQGGDALIMGGTCQETWQHCVPKAAVSGPRIAVVYRPERCPGRK